MGQEISKLPSQSKILDKTGETVLLINRILDFILRNADIADMISLHEPEGCKKWVIIAEQQLTTLFDKIQIQPELGKDGILYLQKRAILDKEASGGKVQKYCKILSFFFIRLFQVVGALALSVLDTQLPDRDYLLEDKKEEIERRGIPFFPKELPKKKLFGLFGGELTGVDAFSDSFKIFNKYLIKDGSIYKIENHFARPVSRVVGWSAEIKDNSIKFINTDIDNNQSITFTIDTASDKLITKETLRNGSPILFTSAFKYEYSSIDGKLYILNKGIQNDFIKGLQDIFREIRTAPKSNTIIILKGLGFLERFSNSVQKISGTNIYIKNSELEASEPTFEFEMKSKQDDKKTISISFEILMNKVDENYRLKIENIKSLSKDIHFDTYLEEREVTFTATRKSITDIRSEYLYNKQTIPKFLENQMLKLYVKAEESIKYGYSETKEGYARPLSDPETRQIWQSLIQKPPIKAFCTARALQLLNVSGLAQTVPKEIHPLIYSTQFPLVKNHSLPSPGNPITSSISLQSLAKLYHRPDYIKNITNSNKETNLQNLIAAFGSAETELSKVIEDSGKKVDKVTNATKISELRNQAIKLFNKQFEHTRKVSQLINKIFIIKNTIELNPAILAKGVKGIEDIAIEARDLLTDYYSVCQIEYKKGVDILKEPTKIEVVPPPMAAIIS
jgi:hypothetical protein